MVSTVLSPLCCPLSCPCSDALQTKVLARDATWQSWRLQVQAQCEDWGAFCSPSFSECPSVGTLGTVLLPMIHCGPTGSQELCSGCSSEQTGSLTESSWIGGAPHLNVGIKEGLQKIDYTTSKAGMQANAAFLSSVQGVGLYAAQTAGREEVRTTVRRSRENSIQGHSIPGCVHTPILPKWSL